MPIPATLGDRARDAFRCILAGISAEPFPQLLRIDEERSLLRQDMTFRALFDPAPPGGDWRWRVTLSEMRQAVQEQDLGMYAPPYREIWEDCCADRRRELGIEIRPVYPPRLTVPAGALAGAEWGRFDGMVALNEFAAIPPEALFGGPAGGGMASSNQAPEPQPALIVDGIRQAIEMMQEANAEQRYQRERAILPGDRCPCPACRRLRSDPEYEAAVAAIREDAARASREREAAESRSVALLKEWLSPAQLAQYERERCFEVTGSAGTRYQISPFKSGNVYEMADGRVIRSWCFGPEGDAGRWLGDVMLAQKLALETDEEGVLAVANRVSGPPRAGERPRAMPPPLNLFGQMMGPGGLF